MDKRDYLIYTEEHRPYTRKPKISYYTLPPNGFRNVHVVCPFCGIDNYFREFQREPLDVRRWCYWCKVDFRPYSAVRSKLLV